MKIYVGNLPFGVGSEKLKELFSSYGEIEEATVISDKFSGRSKGFGFVTFPNDAEAKKAIEAMNEKEIEGRALKVNEAKPMEDRPPRRDEGRRNFGGGGGRSGGSRSGGSGGFNRRRF